MNSYERIYTLLTEWVDPDVHKDVITKKYGKKAGKEAEATRTRRILTLKPKIDRDMFNVAKSLEMPGAKRKTDTPASFRRAHTRGPGPEGSGYSRRWASPSSRSQAEREGWNKI